MTTLTILTEEEVRNAIPIGAPVNIVVPPVHRESDKAYSDRVDRHVQAYTPERANAFCMRSGRPNEVVVEVKDFPSWMEYKGKMLPEFSICRGPNLRTETWFAHPVQFYSL